MMMGTIAYLLSFIGRQKLSLGTLRLALLLLLIVATGSLAARQAEARTQAIGCTEAEFNAALAALPSGGTLTFNCATPAKINFTTSKNIVKQVTIDGSNGG